MCVVVAGTTSRTLSSSTSSDVSIGDGNTRSQTTTLVSPSPPTSPTTSVASLSLPSSVRLPSHPFQPPIFFFLLKGLFVRAAFVLVLVSGVLHAYTIRYSFRVSPEPNKDKLYALAQMHFISVTVCFLYVLPIASTTSARHSSQSGFPVLADWELPVIASRGSRLSRRRQ